MTPASQPPADPSPDATSSRASIGWTRTRRLWAVLAANVVLVIALVLVGIDAHSLAVLAEGADYLADAAAVAVTLLAVRIARRPDGHPKATRYAAAVNAGWLLLLCLLVAAGAVYRLLAGTREVHGLPVLIVSSLAAVVMLGAALLLGGDPDGADPPMGNAEAYEELTVRAVLLDTAADAAAAAGVAVSGAAILLAGGLYWLDPAVALVISTVVAWHAARLLLHIRRVLRH